MYVQLVLLPATQFSVCGSSHTPSKLQRLMINPNSEKGQLRVWEAPASVEGQNRTPAKSARNVSSAGHASAGAAKIKGKDCSHKMPLHGSSMEKGWPFALFSKPLFVSRPNGAF